MLPMQRFSSRTKRRGLQPDGFIVPSQPTLADMPPNHPAWLHEIKHDGFRLIARKDGDRVRLWTRSAYNWTERFQGIAAAIGALEHGSLVIDGEAVCLLPDGRSDFNALYSSEGQRGAVLIAFDILMLDGEDLRPLPCEERRRRLLAAIGTPPDHLQFSEAFDGKEGPALFAAACELGLEGIVSKRRLARYRSGPSRDWLKIKCPCFERG